MADEKKLDILDPRVKEQLERLGASREAKSKALKEAFAVEDPGSPDRGASMEVGKERLANIEAGIPQAPWRPFRAGDINLGPGWEHPDIPYVARDFGPYTPRGMTTEEGEKIRGIKSANWERYTSLIKQYVADKLNEKYYPGYTDITGGTQTGAGYHFQPVPSNYLPEEGAYEYHQPGLRTIGAPRPHEGEALERNKPGFVTRYSDRSDYMDNPLKTRSSSRLANLRRESDIRPFREAGHIRDVRTKWQEMWHRYARFLDWTGIGGKRGGGMQERLQDEYAWWNPLYNPKRAYWGDTGDIVGEGDYRYIGGQNYLGRKGWHEIAPGHTRYDPDNPAPWAGRGAAGLNVDLVGRIEDAVSKNEEGGWEGVEKRARKLIEQFRTREVSRDIKNRIDKKFKVGEYIPKGIGSKLRGELGQSMFGKDAFSSSELEAAKTLKELEGRTMDSPPLKFEPDTSESQEQRFERQRSKEANQDKLRRLRELEEENRRRRRESIN